MCYGFIENVIDCAEQSHSKFLAVEQAEDGEFRYTTNMNRDVLFMLAEAIDEIGENCCFDKEQTKEGYWKLSEAAELLKTTTGDKGAHCSFL